MQAHPLWLFWHESFTKQLPWPDEPLWDDLTKFKNNSPFQFTYLPPKIWQGVRLSNSLLVYMCFCVAQFVRQTHSKYNPPICQGRTDAVSEKED